MHMPALSKRLWIIFATAPGIILLDQVTKFFAKKYLAFHPPIIFWGDFFRFQYALNSGAMLGFGSEWPESVRFWVLTIFPMVLLLGLLVYILLSKQMTTLNLVSLSLISGGGLSNIFDRIYYGGQVVDFMNMGIGDLRTGIFNIADMAIMAGMGILILEGFLMHNKHPHEAGENPPQTPEPPADA
ncbi:MAG TPA: signal peptidase II [Calditrichia bacterium]|nr:signal peptidase II [Calditrichota bacterium]HQU74880.1 signal peptidase II [Calditrichia bacterium]HQV33547.1 signal peptidase II [Calditrichia bacterium]